MDVSKAEFNYNDIRILLKQMYKIRDKHSSINHRMTMDEMAYDLGMSNGLAIGMLEYMRDEMRNKKMHIASR